MAEFKRLFIAINFSDENKNEIYQTVEALKKNSESGNFTRKENLHLTLAFIGETKEFENIKKAMDEVIISGKKTSFSFDVEGLGKFKRREGDIYWIGIKNSIELSNLNKALMKELKQYIPNMEEGEFKPHLTLGRKVITKKEFDRIQLEQSIPSIRINVDHISLMKSERIQGNLVYTEIYISHLYN